MRRMQEPQTPDGYPGIAGSGVSSKLVRGPTMPCFYLKPAKDDFNKIPELQVCLAEALDDVSSIRAVIPKGN